ncbi:MAG: hypothetical protein WC291_12015 [Thermodesulfovibrionales bacterium]|jgi:hypothetical protein
MARAYAQPVGRAGDYTESEQQMTENFLERLETLKQIQQEQLEGLKQAREVQKSGGALPGTPQWDDSWNKVKANETQGRVLNNVLNQLDDLSKPAFFNPPEGVTGVKKLPSGGFLGKDFTRETGIYQNEEARPASEAEPKGFLGGFSNVGSRPGPSKINTPEGEQRFEGLKAVSNAMTGKAEGKIDRFRQTPDQKFLVDQYKVKAQEIKGLTDISDPDGTRRSQLQSEMNDIEERYKKEGAKLGPNAGGFPDVKKEAWPGEEPEQPPQPAGAAADYLEGRPAPESIVDMIRGFEARGDQRAPALREKFKSMFPDMAGLLGDSGGYGNRVDGTPKGNGFFGPLKRPDGKVSTELSVGITLDGKETQIPVLVPTLTGQEVDFLLAGNKPTSLIIQKAIAHARERIAQGKSPFAEEGEQASRDTAREFSKMTGPGQAIKDVKKAGSWLSARGQSVSERRAFNISESQRKKREAEEKGLLKPRF